jgi:hypothetical protein
MVAGYVVALNSMGRERRRIQRFIGKVCRRDGLDPCRQLIILVNFRSNVGERLAMEIAGPGWLDQHGGSRLTGKAGRREAEACWRANGAQLPSFPYKILGGDRAVWLAPFEGSPHLTQLWDGATWLVNDHWQVDTPKRPDGSVPWIVETAGLWRAWMPAPVPRWSFRALLGGGCHGKQSKHP